MKNMADNALKTYKKASSISGLRSLKMERHGSKLNRSDKPSSQSRSFRGDFRRKEDNRPARQSSADEARSVSDRGGKSGNAPSASISFGYDLSRIPAHASSQAVQLPNSLPYGPIQAKLTINQPGDEYEKEADRLAEEVVRMQEPQDNSQEEPEKEFRAKFLSNHNELLVQKQTKLDVVFGAKLLSSRSPGEDPGLERRILSLKGGGQSLPESVRSFFEPRFGYDFSQVRVHTNTAAAEVAHAVNSRAFTAGCDVVFGAGQFAFNTLQGKKLLAHELTHSIQQKAVTNKLPASTAASSANANRINQIYGAPRLQRIRLTGGQFGRAMERYQQDVEIPDRPFRLIWRSGIFRHLVNELDRHYVSLYDNDLTTEFELNPDGTLTNDESKNGEWARGDRRRVILIWSSGVDESSLFLPAFTPDNNQRYDLMVIHDIYYRSNHLPRERIEQDGEFVRSLAHETTHAFNLATGSGTGPSQSLTASIADSVQEEAGSRSREVQILSEIQRRNGLRGYTHSAGSTVPREIERSFVSGTPRRTYLEMFFFNHKLQEARRQITDEEASRIERIVNDIALTAATANRYLNKDSLILYYNNDLGIFTELTSEYGKWLFWQRVIDLRWEAFMRSGIQSPSDKEVILQEHAHAYFDSGVAYRP
jgi:hypothetical protein